MSLAWFSAILIIILIILITPEKEDIENNNNDDQNNNNDVITKVRGAMALAMVCLTSCSSGVSVRLDNSTVIVIVQTL